MCKGSFKTLKMKKEDIYAWDWHRIIIGNTPVIFMIEVFVRTLIIFFVLLIVLRMFGKKMGNSYSILEFSVVITLGAIVCVPMQIHDRGIIPSTIILLSVMVFYKIVTWINTISYKADKLSTGKTIMLVKDGIIDVDQLKKIGISHEQLLSKLRGSAVTHLGQVKRVYLESTGQFSIYISTHPKPGLSVFPHMDKELFENYDISERWYTCRNCGNIELHSVNNCAICFENAWEKAVDTNVKEEVSETVV